MSKQKSNFAKKIYEAVERKRPGIWKHQKNNSYMQALYPNQDPNVKLKEYTIEKIRLCLLVGFACVLIGLLMWIKQSAASEIVYIDRNEYGEGSKEEKLSLVHGDEELSLTLEVEEKEYSTKEQEELYEKFIPELKKQMLGENKSFDRISKDIVLPKTVEGYPFNIDWTIDNEEVISREGLLLKEQVEESELVSITAHVSGNGFSRIEELTLNVYSRDEPFTFEQKIKGYLVSHELLGRSEKRLVLPKQFEGEEIKWTKPKDNFYKIVLLFAPVLMVIIFYCKDRDLSKLVEKRQEELRTDYPNIVSKMALYLGAGLTIVNAWEKVAKSESEKRFAYQEMRITLREIESGVPTSTAFESFGKRCHENCYTKFVSIILQNIKKGSGSASALLRDEAATSFEARKQEAVKLGEKVGTKMLVPMMLLLLVVLIIVMVPAFMNQIF